MDVRTVVLQCLPLTSVRQLLFHALPPIGETHAWVEQRVNLSDYHHSASRTELTRGRGQASAQKSLRYSEELMRSIAVTFTLTQSIFIPSPKAPVVVKIV